MELIRPSFENWGQTPTNSEEIMKWIERCGRICYKSEDKITHDSSIKFCNTMIKSGHHSVIEHSNFVIKERVPSTNPKTHADYIKALLGKRNAYHRVEVHHGQIYINGNIRAWYQTLKDNNNNTSRFIQAMVNLFLETFPQFNLSPYEINHNPFEIVTDPKEIPVSMRMFTVKFICDRGVTHELVRHRPCAFSQESTRYVNYSKKGMQFIIPNWSALIPDIIEPEEHIIADNDNDNDGLWIAHMQWSEKTYNRLISQGWKPQQARSVLPNSLKTEIAVTTYKEEWEWIFKLRKSTAAHPQIRELMIPLHENFKQLDSYNK